jgi:hypothetical protein
VVSAIKNQKKFFLASNNFSAPWEIMAQNSTGALRFRYFAIVTEGYGLANFGTGASG